MHRLLRAAKAVGALCVLSLCTAGFVVADDLSVVPRPFNVQCFEGDEVRFRWGQSSGQVGGYRIYWGRTAGGQHPNRLCDVGAEELQYETRLNDEMTYYLVCRAYNEYGESGDSNEVVWPSED